MPEAMRPDEEEGAPLVADLMRAASITSSMTRFLIVSKMGSLKRPSPFAVRARSLNARNFVAILICRAISPGFISTISK